MKTFVLHVEQLLRQHRLVRVEADTEGEAANRVRLQFEGEVLHREDYEPIENRIVEVLAGDEAAKAIREAALFAPEENEQPTDA